VKACLVWPGVPGHNFQQPNDMGRRKGRTGGRGRSVQKFVLFFVNAFACCYRGSNGQSFPGDRYQFPVSLSDCNAISARGEHHSSSPGFAACFSTNRVRTWASSSARLRRSVQLGEDCSKPSSLLLRTALLGLRSMTSALSRLRDHRCCHICIFELNRIKWVGLRSDRWLDWSSVCILCGCVS
jgi:hypothetical protein